MEFITLPVQLIGRDESTKPGVPSTAFGKIVANRKDVYQLYDYIANLLGYSSYRDAKAEDVHIVTLGTNMSEPYLLLCHSDSGASDGELMYR